MSGSKCLRSLREVKNSEKILKVKRILRESINFSDDDI